MSTALVLECDLARPELRDPKLLYLRRQVRLDVFEDTLPEGWWQALSIGLFRPSRFLLRRRTDDAPIARASTWEIACGFGIGDGRPRTGLIELEVDPAYRRQGYGRLLVAEDAPQAKGRLLADWWSAAGEGNLREVVMLAHRRADVAELNEGARALLRRAGALGEHALVFASDSLIEAGWFGPGEAHPSLRSRVGDYVLLMQAAATIKDWMPGERRHSMIGVHGGASADEMLVPLVVIEP